MVYPRPLRHETLEHVELERCALHPRESQRLVAPAHGPQPAGHPPSHLHQRSLLRTPRASG